MSELGSSRSFVWSIVTAQMLVQIGAFSLPALLPAYIDQWHLTKTEAGSLVGIFFAAYVVAVPLLVALTDRIPARNVYVVGAGLTALSHLGFALVADGFWWGLVLRAAAGIGWAGAYMPGLKAIADKLEGNAQSRAVAAHAAGVGVASASSFAVAGLIANVFGNQAAFLFGGMCALIAIAIALSVMPNKSPAHAKTAKEYRDCDRWIALGESESEAQAIVGPLGAVRWIVQYQQNLHGRSLFQLSELEEACRVTRRERAAGPRIPSCQSRRAQSAP
jgi:MFS family permease